jgi:hypothetical protein
VHTWRIGNLDVTPLGAGAALATVGWLARRSEQSLLSDFLGSYLVALEDGRWRILGDMVHREGSLAESD